MSNIPLEPGESAIGTYTLFYIPPGEKKLNGRLTVTNQRLIQIEAQKSFLSNKVIITLSDESKHVFNRGAMIVSRLADIIKI